MRLTRRTSTTRIEMSSPAKPRTASSEAIQRIITRHKTSLKQALARVPKVGPPINKKYCIKQLCKELLLCNTSEEEHDNTTKEEDSGAATQLSKLGILTGKIIIVAALAFFGIDASPHVNLEPIVSEYIKPATIDDEIKKDMLIAFIEEFIIRPMRDRITHNRQNAEQQLTKLLEIICNTIKEKEFKRTVLDAYIEASILKYRHLMMKRYENISRDHKEFCLAAFLFMEALAKKQRTDNNKGKEETDCLEEDLQYNLLLVPPNVTRISTNLIKVYEIMREFCEASTAGEFNMYQSLAAFFTAANVSQETTLKIYKTPNREPNAEMAREIARFVDTNQNRVTYAKEWGEETKLTFRCCCGLQSLDQKIEEYTQFMNESKSPEEKLTETRRFITELNQWIKSRSFKNMTVPVVIRLVNNLLRDEITRLEPDVREKKSAIMIQRNYLERYKKRNNRAGSLWASRSDAHPRLDPSLRRGDARCRDGSTEPLPSQG